jgi:hypothetical protein
MSDYLEEEARRSELARQRWNRFFGDDGLVARFQCLGDHLVQFHQIVAWLTSTVPGLSREAVIRRFLFSVKNIGFGRHGPRQTIERLIDLDDFSYVPRGAYSLRPSYLRVEAVPGRMRARRSVWAQWLQTQGWPVPPELSTSDAQVKKPKPQQSAVDADLLARVRQLGRKVKQSDDVGHDCQSATGATSRQIIQAFRNLPEDLRNLPGKPRR